MARQIVVDANATLGLFLRLPYSGIVEQWFIKQQDHKVDFNAPVLWEYECLTGIKKALVINMISSKDAYKMVRQLMALKIKTIPPTEELHAAALEWTKRIGQSKMYDAHYLALTEYLAADFWTADARLTDSVRRLGVNWIYCFGDVASS